MRVCKTGHPVRWARRLFLNGMSLSPEQKWIYGAACLVLIGVCMGALLFRFSVSTDLWLACFFGQYKTMRDGASYGAVLLYTVQPLLQSEILLLLLGGSVCGVGVIPLLLVFHGLGFGTALGYLYQCTDQYALLGALLSVLPHGICTTGLLLLQSRESFLFSRQLGQMLFCGKVPMQAQLRHFACRSAVVVAGLLACALINAFVTYILFH